MAPKTATAEPQLFLENMELGVTGTIVLMLCRMWDVYAATGRYLSTDFIVCDSKGSTMHATAKGNIVHNFLKLKEGGIYSVKNFVPDGFIRFPFQLVDFDNLEITNNKYLIDAARFVTNVGRAVQQKTWSKTLDFHLANSRCLTMKQYKNRLYLSSTSSTLILDDEEIPEVKHLKTNRSGAEFSKEILPEGCSEAKAGTLENLLMWTRNGWNFLSCGGEKCKKSVTRSNDHFLCEYYNKIVDYPVLRYRLELEVSDDTAEVVVVMFSEMATSLVKCTTDSIVEYEDQHNTYEIFTCWRIVTAEGMGESGGSSMAGGSRASETPGFKLLLRHLSVTTPSKVDEVKKQKRGEAEESDAEASFVADTQAASGVGGNRLNTRKNKRQLDIGHVLHLAGNGTEVSYHNIGAPSYQCAHCNASMWYEERINKGNRAVRNCMGAFIDKDDSDAVDATIVQSLAQMLDQYSSLAKAFWIAMDWYHSYASVNVELHLLFERTNARQYNKPTIVEVATLITNNFGDMIPSRDIIVNKLHSGPQRILELHPTYMALHIHCCFCMEKIVSMRRYLTILTKYLVDAYSAIEEQRLKWTRSNQDTLRVDLYHNVCDAVTREDTNAAGLGQRIVLPDYMLHGPCGKDGRYAPCTTEGKCSKHYPKQFYAETVLDEDGNGRSLTDFQDLPCLNPQLLTNMDNRLIREALNFAMNKSRIEHERLHPLLNPEQRLVYEQVIDYVHNQRGQFYFVFGPGGTGKTFLYNTIIARLRTERKIVLAVASSGIAALLPPAELMQEVQLIIWDKAPMTQKYAFEALDKTLRDILGFQNPEKREQIFRGMTVLLGGDFRQILPVIPKGKRPDVVQACSSIEKIVAETYPNFIEWQHDDEYLKEQAIPTPRNDDVDEINNYMFNKLARKFVTYNSADEICKASTESLDQQQLYPTEF
ncbi:ATP-dependent DNA helicase PIF1-like protein [Tanacetum coccineum]